MILGKCLTCKKGFKSKNQSAKFCSSKCYGLAMKMRVIPAMQYWLGKKRDKKTIEKIRFAHLGTTPWNKGKKNEYKLKWAKETKENWDKVWNKYRQKVFKTKRLPYRMQHKYIQLFLGKPNTCQHCLRSGLSGHQIHWANISGQYKQRLTDWMRLCVKCHMAYDKQQRQLQLYTN